jgi:hypothetical protein
MGAESRQCRDIEIESLLACELDVDVASLG